MAELCWQTFLLGGSCTQQPAAYSSCNSKECCCSLVCRDAGTLRDEACSEDCVTRRELCTATILHNRLDNSAAVSYIAHGKSIGTLLFCLGEPGFYCSQE
jgi:hypothetical protein